MRCRGKMVLSNVILPTFGTIAPIVPKRAEENVEAAEGDFAKRAGFVGGGDLHLAAASTRADNRLFLFLGVLLVDTAERAVDGSPADGFGEGGYLPARDLFDRPDENGYSAIEDVSQGFGCIRLGVALGRAFTVHGAGDAKPA